MLTQGKCGRLVSACQYLVEFSSGCKTDWTQSGKPELGLILRVFFDVSTPPPPVSFGRGPVHGVLSVCVYIHQAPTPPPPLTSEGVGWGISVGDSGGVCDCSICHQRVSQHVSAGRHHYIRHKGLTDSYLFVPHTAQSLGEVLDHLDMHEFVEYAQGSGLTNVLNGKAKGNFTIFVPSADAFAGE